jgi:16S rRNA (guanine(966)-N(2))-methyltransferase RsmD
MAQSFYRCIVRIIGGEFKGRRIDPPASFRARPTTDFARESLLNILDNRYDFNNVTFLDLFAGTGAISYELASRGCRDIDLVETDRRHCEFINGSFRTLGIKSARVHRIDVRNWLKICHKQYDIIFADPPFALPWLTEIPDMVLSSAAVHKESVFILEHPKSFDFSSHPAFSEHRNYGNVNFSFFRSVL